MTKITLLLDEHRRSCENLSYSLLNPLFSINRCRTVGLHQSQPKADQPLAEPSRARQWEKSSIRVLPDVSSFVLLHQIDRLRNTFPG